MNYISHPVINSFTTAAAVTIGFGQVKVSGVSSASVPPDHWSCRGCLCSNNAAFSLSFVHHFSVFYYVEIVCKGNSRQKWFCPSRPTFLQQLKLWACSQDDAEVLLYVHRNRRTSTSTFTQLLISEEWTQAHDFFLFLFTTGISPPSSAPSMHTRNVWGQCQRTRYRTPPTTPPPSPKRLGSRVVALGPVLCSVDTLMTWKEVSIPSYPQWRALHVITVSSADGFPHPHHCNPFSVVLASDGS